MHWSDCVAPQEEDTTHVPIQSAEFKHADKICRSARNVGAAKPSGGKGCIQFLFLGGNASRTPASGGSDTQGPDCLELDCIRVFFVKWKPFSSNVRFLRATDERAFLQNYVPATLLIWSDLGSS
jgi:hypothetical protein